MWRSTITQSIKEKKALDYVIKNSASLSFLVGTRERRTAWSGGEDIFVSRYRNKSIPANSYCP